MGQAFNDYEKSIPSKGKAEAIKTVCGFLFMALWATQIYPLIALPWQLIYPLFAGTVILRLGIAYILNRKKFLVDRKYRPPK